MLNWPVFNSLAFFPALQRYMLCFPFLACQSFLHLSQVLRLSVSSLSITVDFYPARTPWKRRTYITLLLSRPSLYTLFFAVGCNNIWSQLKLLGPTETKQVPNTSVSLCYQMVDWKSREAKFSLCLFVTLFSYYPSCPLQFRSIPCHWTFWLLSVRDSWAASKRVWLIREEWY